MRMLVDTHALIWHFEDSPSLSPSARRSLNDPQNRLFISVVSSWELAVKASLGKLTLGSPVHEMIDVYVKRGATLLPMTPEHAMGVQTLPWHHRDPFDRMLITQALQEDLTFLTHDVLNRQYDVPHVW